MTEAEIKSLMRAKGLTVMGLAKQFDKSHTTIHFWIKRQLKSRELDRQMARALGVKVKDVRTRPAA